MANSEDVADAGNDTLTSPEPASVFLEALSGDWSMHGAGQKYYRINIQPQQEQLWGYKESDTVE